MPYEVIKKRTNQCFSCFFMPWGMPENKAASVSGEYVVFFEKGGEIFAPPVFQAKSEAYLLSPFGGVGS